MLSVPAALLRQLDTTIHHRTHLGNGDGPCQKQVRTGGRKRTSPPATYHPPPTRQTTSMHQNGPNAPRASSKSSSNLEASAFHCPTRDEARGGIDRDARLFWKYKSRAASHEPKIPTETIALIKEMAVQNRLWGAERLRGEFLKVGLHVSLPHDPEIYETGTYDSTKRPELEDLLAQPCQRDLGQRRVSQSLTSSSARFSLSSSSNCTRGG